MSPAKKKLCNTGQYCLLRQLIIALRFLVEANTRHIAL